MHLAIRADGGPSIGYGHLVRASALAEILVDNNMMVTVATTTPEAASSIFPDPVSIVSLPSREDPAPFCDWLETTEVEGVFTDAYPIDTDYQRAVREHTPLIVFQDDARHAVCADAFINGNLYAAELDYEFISRKPQTYLGPEYALLRNEIRERTTGAPPWREDPERALVTMGGSDVADLTPRALRAFDGFDLRVDAIVGPGVSDEKVQEISEVATEVSAEVCVARDPADLPERMFQADFAVSTASSTTYELLALGTPIVSCPVVDNQNPIAAALLDKDAATVLENNDGQPAFRQAIKRYIKDASLRHQRRKHGRELVDARGAERVHAKIVNIVEGNPQI